MSELLERLKAGRAATGSVAVNGVTFGLKLLTEQDYFDAGMAVDAVMRIKEIPLELGTAELFEAEKAAQLICRFLVDPATSTPVCADANEARSAFTRGENAVVVNEYLEFEKAHSPSGRTLTDAEFNALYEEVKKNPSTPRLNDSSSATLKRLITSLASQPAA